MTIDPRTVAADIMCAYARDVSRIDVAAHIGQAYDNTEHVDASFLDEVADLIAKAGIDLIWPDGSTNTELDAARVEIERLNNRVATVAAEREHMELHPTGTVEWLKNRVAELTAERDFARDMANTARAEAADAIRALDQANTQIAGREKNIDQQHAEISRLRQHVDDLQSQLFAQQPVVEATEAWAELYEDPTSGHRGVAETELHDAIEQYRVMDLALTNARAEHRCPNCAPGYDCERGIYTPAVTA